MARVTQNMLSSQLLTNLNRNLNRSQIYQNQLSTGQKINKPSDDPVGISFSMRYRNELSVNDQYEKNVDNAISWLDYSDTMMSQVGKVLDRARELTVNASNSPNPDTALDAINSEIKQLYSQLVTIGNSQFNGKYVFNGEKTDVKPYTEAKAFDESTDNGIIKIETGVGVTMGVNITGNEVFGEPGSDNAFQILKDLSAKLTAVPVDSVAISDMLTRFDSRIDKNLETRADIGAKANRIELSQDRLADINLNLTSLRSKTEDADMSEVILHMKENENIYQASLSAGSKIIQPSLVDFLR
ncbi:flagellar hook-associated protein FlgL [Paenibacillus sp. N1-5-1-14]|uniref:flagellar hook-associated protein FlgL n=1 Tax=Paenibacillus radicibacter TaxID=2972488 RepID=UPI002158C476|nr:flagellar hook-associated protein FlgL [Paenibacillus radicibacter]MCR8645042.1 flagellar hook-associated protein FlgL [Paenibacillus radicibacter]